MIYGICSRSSAKQRWISFAYDIASPAHARRVRALLSPHAGSHQYSVWECRLTAQDLSALLSALREIGLPTTDRLAWWWPKQGMRLALQGGDRCTLRDAAGLEQGSTISRAASRLAGSGNYIVSYDIRDQRALQAVHAEVASGGVRLQRSVYQWRCGIDDLMRSIERCAALVKQRDAFWVQPLARINDLRRLRGPRHDLLPIGTHHWRKLLTPAKNGNTSPKSKEEIEDE